ncbi:MAG: DUF503 domain-containing protein [Nitrospirae bacterium]|nr:DUF503 domain-containing protein [Nitrospirota bacterium]MBI4838562.1 DUF503 domain-containing protein [Nitrospirota bacterium]
MLVGILTLELHLLEADSLKSKRFILKSLKDRIRNKFNVSVAEVGGNDLWQRTVIGIACVANETRVIHQSLNGIREMALNIPTVELINSKMEIL